VFGDDRIIRYTRVDDVIGGASDAAKEGLAWESFYGVFMFSCKQLF